MAASDVPVAVEDVGRLAGWPSGRGPVLVVRALRRSRRPIGACSGRVGFLRDTAGPFVVTGA